MLAHGLLRLPGVARLQRGEQAGMADHRRELCWARFPVGSPEAQVVQQQAVSRFLKQRVAHRVNEEPVNRVVVAQEFLVVSSVASAVGRFDEPSQRC